MEKTFLITIVNTKTSICEEFVVIKGETLYAAILKELIANGGTFMFWDAETLEEDTSPEEKAIIVLDQLERIDYSDKSLTTTDITDFSKIIIIFPKDQRSVDFDPFIIGRKFYINAWNLACDKEDRPSFTSLSEARKELDHLRMLHPENIYRLEGK